MELNVLRGLRPFVGSERLNRPRPNLLALDHTVAIWWNAGRVIAYLVAPSTSTAVLHQGVLVCGEMVISRLDKSLRKTYSYVYGVAMTGGTVFGAHYKNFRLHHTPSSCTAEAAAFSDTTLSHRIEGSDGAA